MLEYTILGTLYNKLNKDCDYEKWSQYLNFLLSANGIKNGTGYDLGCGCGQITYLLYKAGHKMTGIDLSVAMLNAAISHTTANNANLPFINCDMTNFRTQNKADFITVINDGINYIKPANLKKTFCNFYDNLKNGGILLFDISSEYKLTKILGNNVFYEDHDDLTYLWQNTLKKDSVIFDLVFFIKKDGLYEKYCEQHIQYILSSEKVLEILRNVGFKKVRALQFLKNTETKNNDERIQFIAEK